MLVTRSAFAGSCLLLAACSGPLETFYREGGTVSRLETDMLACEVSALENAPVANEIRQRPPMFVSSPHFCTSPAYCYGGGQWAGGGIYSVDVNRGLRTRIKDQCMADKGYTRASIPFCSSSVAAQVQEQRTTVMPALNAGSCVVRNPDGSYQLVQTR